ncbi:hypothetical protein CYMTET_15753 [Cymbomonas tetramitiformis]|uniref:LysM domain-containing protein n=1 Tax=Cymbomonas tetramitiformis TaxID=36881 RepID=A0AAE0GDY3_9CHLO|nr:hypothetical protein CYMTET_15753 [Cymbomonas tetramitiformis]
MPPERKRNVWLDILAKVAIGSVLGAVAARECSRRRAKGAKILLEIVVKEGDTVGDIITQYVGDYTVDNLRKVTNLNKKTVPHLDFIRAGDVIVVPDNRRPELATAEADWWRRRARSGDIEDTEDLQTTGSTLPPLRQPLPQDPQSDRWAGDRWDKGDSFERGPPPQSSGRGRNKVRLLQDDW